MQKLIDINGTELVPEIDTVVKRGLVSQGICWDWQAVEEALLRRP